MASKSFKQALMMARAAGDPDYAAERNVPFTVAQEFHEADKKEGLYVDPDGNMIAAAESRNNP